MTVTINSPFLDLFVELCEDGMVFLRKFAVVEAADEVDLLVQLVVESADNFGQGMVGHDGDSIWTERSTILFNLFMNKLLEMTLFVF